jgi:hypothetical protein
LERIKERNRKMIDKERKRKVKKKKEEKKEKGKGRKVSINRSNKY